MKKLLTILLMFFCGLAIAQTGENPPTGTKILQAPNSPTFLFYQPDTSIWISMGAYGKAELQRANKKYPIWNHTGISNTGWTPSKVLGFDVSGNLVPVAAGSGSMVYPAAGIALSNGSGWAASLTDNSAIWNKAITSDAPFSAANYLLKTADTGRKAVASGVYEDGATGFIGVQHTTPAHYLDIRKTLNSRTNYGLNVSMTASTLQSDVTSTGNDENLINQYYAWKFTANGAHTVGSCGVRLKKTGTVTNTTDYIRIRLYSDNAGVPNTLLATSDQVKMGTITTSYVEYLFGFDYTLVNGTTYWIAVERSAAVTGGGTISVDRNATALTTAGVSSPTSGDWTINSGLGRFILYGQSPRAVSGSSTNSIGVFGSSTNSYGVYGSSTNSNGVFGTSTNSSGVSGSSTNSYGVSGTSTNSIGVFGSSTNSYGAIFYQNGTLTQGNSLHTLYVRRYGVTNSTGSFNYSGNILQLTDNPTGTGTVSGSLIRGSVDGTDRLDFNPRVADGASAVASFEDTKNALSNTTAKLKSFRNNGNEKAYIRADGMIYAPNFGAGVVPSAYIHIKAGTASASTAPLKFTSGTNLTTPEAGAMEFDGSRLYFTPSTTRKTLSFDENIKTINGNSLIGTGDLTITASQVYPGAGLAKSTGSGWATSITDNSANWNTAYGWGNHASQGYVNSILINGTSGENAGGFLDFIPGSGINITKTGGHVTIAATGGGSGTVTSVGLSAPTGFSVTGSPVTTSGTLGLSFAAGYSLPSDATQANWTTAFNNRIATFTTTGNSGAATFSGNTLNIPTYTLAGLGGQPTVGANVSFGYNGNWVALDGSLVRYSNTILQRFADIGGGTYVGSTFPAASTTEAGLMSATDKTNLDAAYSNIGKVTVGGGAAYGDMSSTYFNIIGGAIVPKIDSSPTDGSSLPTTSNAVYDGLALKANLSGATFTGAISGTSATFSSTVTASDFQLSDRRLKTDIRRLKDISWADRIDFVSYRMKADSLQRLRYGVIAQDVEKYAPELVNTDENGTKSVSYIDLLIVKNQQLQNQINFQRYEILFSICLSCFLFVVVILRGSKRT